MVQNIDYMGYLMDFYNFNIERKVAISYHFRGLLSSYEFCLMIYPLIEWVSKFIYTIMSSIVKSLFTFTFSILAFVSFITTFLTSLNLHLVGWIDWSCVASQAPKCLMQDNVDKLEINSWF